MLILGHADEKNTSRLAQLKHGGGTTSFGGAPTTIQRPGCESAYEIGCRRDER